MLNGKVLHKFRQLQVRIINKKMFSKNYLERPIQQPINKDSLSSLIGNNSHVSLIRNRGDSSTQSIVNALEKVNTI